MSAQRDRRAGDGRQRSGAAARTRPGRLDETRAVFMISVAAELAEMHPQTLRMYEARGLITPKRSPKNTRLYSLEDVERLRRIQQMTAEEGLNLAGVESVLELEDELHQARAELRRMRRRADQLEQRMLDEIERVKRSFRAEIVPYGAYEPEAILGSRAAVRNRKSPEGERPVRIRVSRRRDARG
jgi:MerR family transcriptional regulator, heat shock protein HspR